MADEQNKEICTWLPLRILVILHRKFKYEYLHILVIVNTISAPVWWCLYWQWTLTETLSYKFGSWRSFYFIKLLLFVHTIGICTTYCSIHSGILCSHVLGTVYMELTWVVRSARLLSKRDLVIHCSKNYRVFIVYGQASFMLNCTVMVIELIVYFRIIKRSSNSDS